LIPEEIQSVNPYALLTSYKKGFNYRYVGEKTRQGKRGHEIILTPKTSQDIKSITLNVKENSSPVYIAIQLQNGEKQEFQISSYRTGVNLPDAVFRFDKSKYPGAEIIDLR
jgi:outer membrane lipoprotein-sorting protein